MLFVRVDRLSDYSREYALHGDTSDIIIYNK